MDSTLNTLDLSDSRLALCNRQGLASDTCQSGANQRQGTQIFSRLSALVSDLKTGALSHRVAAVHPHLNVARTQLGGQLCLNALGQSHGIIAPCDGVGADRADLEDKCA